MYLTDGGVMPLYSLIDYGGAIIIGGVIYERIATNVLHYPDVVVPDGAGYNDYTYNLVDANGFSTYPAARHAQASAFTYVLTTGQPDGIKTLYTSAPFTGMMRIWVSSINGGIRTLYINGVGQQFRDMDHKDKINAKPISINVGDSVTINAYWSSHYYAVIYPYIYAGEDLDG